jgi:hypothetical protein
MVSGFRSSMTSVRGLNTRATNTKCEGTLQLKLITINCAKLYLILISRGQIIEHVKYYKVFFVFESTSIMMHGRCFHRLK